MPGGRYGRCMWGLAARDGLRRVGAKAARPDSSPDSARPTHCPLVRPNPPSDSLGLPWTRGRKSSRHVYASREGVVCPLFVRLSCSKQGPSADKLQVHGGGIRPGDQPFSPCCSCLTQMALLLLLTTSFTPCLPPPPPRTRLTFHTQLSPTSPFHTLPATPSTPLRSPMPLALTTVCLPQSLSTTRSSSPCVLVYNSAP